MNAIYVMEICVLWKIKRRHESGFRDNVQANSSGQEGRESADQVQESSGDDYSERSLDSLRALSWTTRLLLAKQAVLLERRKRKF